MSANALACRREEGGIAKARCEIISPASKPVRGDRQPGSPDDGPDQAGRADRGGQHQIASSGAPGEARDDARQPDGTGRELSRQPILEGLVAAKFDDQVRFTRGPEYVFHHPLIRTVAYESQLKSDRAELHRRVAAAIESRDPTAAEDNAALIAEHLEAAGDLPVAYGWHMRAATWVTNRDIAAARLELGARPEDRRRSARRRP